MAVEIESDKSARDGARFASDLDLAIDARAERNEM